MMFFIKALTISNPKMKSPNTGNSRQLMFLQLIFIISACLSGVTATTENRINLCIVTDEAYPKQCFGGNEEAAFNLTIKLIDDINQHLLNEEFVYTDPEGKTHHYINFGFHPRKIYLSHEAFYQLNQQQTLNVDHLKTTLCSSDLDYERKDNGLVAFFSGKQFTDKYNGFKWGTVCSRPYNSIAVSFHKCENPLKIKSEAYNGVLITTFHELLHSIGVNHSNTNNDVMKEFDANNMDLSMEKKKFIAEGFYKADKTGCLTVEGKNVKLVYQSGKEKAVKYHQVVEHMSAISKSIKEKEETVDKPFTLDTSLSDLYNYSWLFIGFGALICIILFFVLCKSSKDHRQLPSDSEYSSDGYGTQGPRKTKAKKPKMAVSRLRIAWTLFTQCLNFVAKLCKPLLFIFKGILYCIRLAYTACFGKKSKKD